jgi:serine/threonine protein kinase
MVRKMDNVHWSQCLKEVETLRSRKHEHIIPLLASFSAGREAPVTANDPQECLHMLFPCAQGGDLKSWLESSEDLVKVEERSDYVYKAAQHLVSAVTYIHRDIKDKIAFHHDLKPGNILLFIGRNGPIWKICDFGNARLKDIDGESGTGTAHTETNKFGTYDYRPPEYFIGPDAGKEENHGRPFDVFSLGCVLLDLATVLEYGWSNAGLPEFKRRRGENKEHSYTGPEKPERDYSFHNSPKVVKAWIEHLRTDGSNNLCTLLDLISLMLLDQKDQRIFSWEVEMDLYEMLHPNLKQAQRQKRLRELVQESRTPRARLDNRHNPLQRAYAVGKPEWWKTILKENKWSYSEPTTTLILRQRTFPVDKYFSTLNAFEYTEDFRNNELYGRHDIYQKIATGFESSESVGLYGMGGIGYVYYQIVSNDSNL